MKQRPHRNSRRAFMLLESLISIGLTLVLIALLAGVIQQYANVRHELDERRILRAAAETELARVRAGIRTLGDGGHESPPATQPADITIRVESEPGRDAWAGLTLVRVEASRAMTPQRRLSVRVAGYVDSPEER